MTKYYVLILLLLLVVAISGCVINPGGSNDNSTKQETTKESYSNEQILNPIITKELDTGQKLRIYLVKTDTPTGSDICYISEVVNGNHIVTSGGISCVH